MKVSSDSCFGKDTWPPGFRFHPTDEELVLYYLKRKICKKRLKMNLIAETDVYKWDPEELPGQSLLKTGDRQWFFFSPRDRKYPNGARSNRATRNGYWKATGKDRSIICNSRTVGVKKTLVFYRGRAPNGERTDWVMHEYTLDEEELKRCQNVQDSFALYKAYKKSGPGPKNGEQYGAPFREEDWIDDECLNVSNTADSEVPTKQCNEVTPVDDVRVNGQVQFPLDDIEELMKQITDDPALPQPQIGNYAYALPQVVGEEETQSTVEHPSSREVILSEPIRVFAPSGEQYDELASFDFPQSATLKSQPNEAPEVTSTPKTCALALYEEDFLEIDDLLGPEPTFSGVEKPVQNLQLDELDGLSEFDLYHDAAMFLQDIGSIAQGSVSHPYDAFGINAANELNNHSQPHPVVSQVDYQFEPQTVVNQVGYHMHSNFFDAGQISSELWSHQQSEVFTPSESDLGTSSIPSPGSVCEPTNLPAKVNQDQAGKQTGGATSLLSSALWAFVESIPTTPASASENPLVNRAFERMSSFGRVRLNAMNTNVAAGNGSATVRRAGGSKRFFFLSILGVLCAIFWVFIGTVRISGRSIFSRIFM